MALGHIVAENLRAVRTSKKLSQEAVARKAGLSVSYISMLEREERTPTLNTLETLAKALSVPALELLHESRKARGRP